MEYINAFWVGGLFCMTAQILIDRTKLTPARILVGYVSVGVLLTAAGLYEPVIKYADCGASVPLTGFGYSIAKGVEKAIDEYGLIGALGGGFTACASGIAAALIFGYLAALIFKGRPK